MNRHFIVIAHHYFYFFFGFFIDIFQIILCINHIDIFFFLYIIVRLSPLVLTVVFFFIKFVYWMIDFNWGFLSFPEPFIVCSFKIFNAFFFHSLTYLFIYSFSFLFLSHFSFFILRIFAFFLNFLLLSFFLSFFLSFIRFSFIYSFLISLFFLLFHFILPDGDPVSNVIPLPCHLLSIFSASGTMKPPKPSFFFYPIHSIPPDPLPIILNLSPTYSLIPLRQNGSKFILSFSKYILLSSPIAKLFFFYSSFPFSFKYFTLGFFFSK